MSSFYEDLDTLMGTWLAPLLTPAGGEMLGVHTNFFSAPGDLLDLVGQFKESIPAIYLSTPGETIDTAQLSEGSQRTRANSNVSYAVAVVVANKSTVEQTAPLHYRQRDLLMKEIHGRFIKASEYITCNGVLWKGDRTLMTEFQLYNDQQNQAQISFFRLQMRWHGYGGISTT